MCLLHAADVDLDPFSKEAIKQANPALGKFQVTHEVMDMAEAARRMPSREAEFRNLILNQRVEASSPFVTPSVWQDNAEEPDSLGAIYGGLDLSETNDLTALVLVSPQQGQLHVKPVFWLPEEGIEERARKDRVPYDLWAKQGHLNTTPGRSVEYAFVADYIVGLFDKYEIRRGATGDDAWGRDAGSLIWHSVLCALAERAGLASVPARKRLICS